ncbi:hypothetical protein N431DRAFT_403702 [Stipitochalara longipes BDJ]|nr:hypothetical protein N431DRAFT_403702 [Stipitochalara longipes BDJ]
MSKIRGVFPLFLATTFGIVNGIWVFQPLLAAQQEGKDDLSKQALESTQQAKDSEVKTPREAEEATIRSSATEAALNPIQPTRSWWSNTRLWSKTENTAAKDSTESDRRVKATKTSKDTKEQSA